MFVNLNICLYFQVCTKLGPLVAFESILSVHGDEVSMLNDMIVVVEDLRNVEFNLILVDKKSKFKLKRNSSQAKSSPAVPMLEYHSFPLPRITGSRSSLKVHNGLISILKENSWIYFSRNMSSILLVYTKVSFFGLCSKMQIIPIKNLNIKKSSSPIFLVFQVKMLI